MVTIAGLGHNDGPQEYYENMWFYISMFVCWLCLEASEIMSAELKPSIGL